MSGSRWVITPSWLSGSWRSFLYSSSVYCCHLFLISSASVASGGFFRSCSGSFNLASGDLLMSFLRLSNCDLLWNANIFHLLGILCVSLEVGLVMDRDAWGAAVHGVTKSRTWLSDWTELNWRWNQDPVPRLHYCFLAAPPLSLHPVPSVINSSSLNLSFGIHGRSWRLESIPYRQETAGEEGRKASVARSPTGSCFVSGGRWENRTENVGKGIPRRESVPNVGINPQQKRGEWGERRAGRQPSEGRAAIIPVGKWRRQKKGLQAPQRLWGA